VSSSILSSTPIDLAEIKPDLPDHFSRIVNRCLEKSPADRYASAADVRDELRALRREMDGDQSELRTVRSQSAAGTRRITALALATLSLLTVATLAWWLLFARSNEDDATKIIAVLPFENLSPDAENAFFTTGIHDDVMTKLGGLRNFRIVSRTSVHAVERDTKTLREIGERFGARYIVEGSVRRVEDQVRVSAQLIDVETDQSMWSDSFDRELRNVLAVQSEIAQEIAMTLNARLSSDERAQLQSAPTVVVAAYDRYLKARNIMNASWVPFESLIEAIGHLEATTDIDPRFADGWALLSLAESDRVYWLRDFDNREAGVDSAATAAKAALLRARELAPNSAAALKAQGYYEYVVEDDLVSALRAFDRALEKHPSASETLTLQAQIYTTLGQVDAAVENLEKAYEIDSDNGRLVYSLTFAYEIVGRYGDMVPIFERLARLEPERTHLEVQARYYRFLSEGSLDAFRELEHAVKTVERTEQCNVRSVQDREMVVAMVNGEFDAYSQALEGKWDRHHANHGNWSCPMIINDGVNHANLHRQFGDPAKAIDLVQQAMEATTRPYTEMSICIFDRDAFEPKLLYLSGDSLAARRAFDAAVPKILQNDTFPRGPVERMVLLQTADLVAPDRVYSLYREIENQPASMISLAAVCANPWTFPNLLRDPGFVTEVRNDGRFVEFLEAYDVIPKGGT
jgi:TolB-like protein/lipopolysaccharide biosynthesis regulator YciM